MQRIVRKNKEKGQKHSWGGHVVSTRSKIEMDAEKSTMEYQDKTRVKLPHRAYKDQASAAVLHNGPIWTVR